MITVDELLRSARPLIERAARDLAQRAIEQAEAQFEHDLELLLAGGRAVSSVVADPTPAVPPRPRGARSEVSADRKAQRPCGCAWTGPHRRTCSLAGGAKRSAPAPAPEPDEDADADDDDDDDDEEEDPPPAPARGTRFARIEASRSRRQSALELARSRTAERRGSSEP